VAKYLKNTTQKEERFILTQSVSPLVEGLNEANLFYSQQPENTEKNGFCRKLIFSLISSVNPAYGMIPPTFWVIHLFLINILYKFSTNTQRYALQISYMLLHPIKLAIKINCHIPSPHQLDTQTDLRK
jgi:hypothetical protein